MYPPNQHHSDPKNYPTSSPPPATGIPVNHYNYLNDNPQHPINHRHQGQEGKWSSGLCDCCSDCKTCCLTCWCPCITFGRIAEIVDQGTTSCGASGAIYAVLSWLTGCGCLYSCLYRSKMRHQYMLQERPCNDCLVHCCCDSCALCQEYRELQSRGFDMSIGWDGNTERRNGGVAMAAPSAPVFEESMIR